MAPMRRIAIFDAAGRDFHDFNTVLRDDPEARHPMPYGDLAAQACQRFATYADLDREQVSGGFEVEIALAIAGRPVKA